MNDLFKNLLGKLISKSGSPRAEANQTVNLDKTLGEILPLFSRRSDIKGPSDPRVEILIAMMFDLLMEVEALRRALLASEQGGSVGENSLYGLAYRETALLRHNSAGLSDGLDKLLACFYPNAGEEPGQVSRQQRSWRECVMLHRLGFSEVEIRQYKEEAESAEQLT